MGCTYAVDLSASILDDEANYTQYALLSAVAAAAADASDSHPPGDPVAATSGAPDGRPRGATSPPDTGESGERPADEDAGGDAQAGKAAEEEGVEVGADTGGAVAGAASAASVFGCLVELVRFLREHVFCGNDDVLGAFMEGFWPQCTEHAAQAAGAVTDHADELQRTIEVCPISASPLSSVE